MTSLNYLGHSMVQHFKRLRACSADCLVNSRESSVSYSGSVTERALFSPDILVAILCILHCAATGRDCTGGCIAAYCCVVSCVGSCAVFTYVSLIHHDPIRHSDPQLQPIQQRVARTFMSLQAESQSSTVPLPPSSSMAS